MTLLSTFELMFEGTLRGICNKTFGMLYDLPAIPLQISVLSLVSLQRQALVDKHVDFNRHIGVVGVRFIS